MAEELEKYVEVNYSSENWANLSTIKTNGDAAINAATTPAAVTDAKNNAIDAMAEVKTLAQEAAEALAAAKTTAKGELTTELAKYDEADYSSANWIVLTGAKTAGDTAIDNATTTGDVTTAKNNAIDAMAEVKTLAQEAAEALAAAKTTAKGELTTELAKYDEADYSSANWIVLTGAKTAGDTAIDNATTPAAVTDAKNNAIDEMAAVKTLAQEAAAALELAKTNALAELAEELEKYVEVNYSSENWANLSTIKTNGDAAINAATTPAAVTDAKNNAIDAMAAVKTLAQEKIAAKDNIKVAYEILEPTKAGVISGITLEDNELLYEVKINTTYDTKAKAQASGRSVNTEFKINTEGVTVYYYYTSDGSLTNMTLESATSTDGFKIIGMPSHPLSADNIDDQGVIYLKTNKVLPEEISVTIKLVDSVWSDVEYASQTITKEKSTYKFNVSNENITLYKSDLIGGIFDPTGLTPINIGIAYDAKKDYGYVGNVITKVTHTATPGTLQLWGYGKLEGVDQWINIGSYSYWGPNGGVPIDMDYNVDFYGVTNTNQENFTITIELIDANTETVVLASKVINVTVTD